MIRRHHSPLIMGSFSIAPQFMKEFIQVGRQLHRQVHKYQDGQQNLGDNRLLGWKKQPLPGWSCPSIGISRVDWWYRRGYVRGHISLQIRFLTIV